MNTSSVKIFAASINVANGIKMDAILSNGTDVPVGIGLREQLCQSPYLACEHAQNYYLENYGEDRNFEVGAAVSYPGYCSGNHVQALACCGDYASVTGMICGTEYDELKDCDGYCLMTPSEREQACAENAFDEGLYSMDNDSICNKKACDAFCGPADPNIPTINDSCTDHEAQGCATQDLDCVVDYGGHYCEHRYDDDMVPVGTGKMEENCNHPNMNIVLSQNHEKYFVEHFDQDLKCRMDIHCQGPDWRTAPSSEQNVCCCYPDENGINCPTDTEHRASWVSLTEKVCGRSLGEEYPSSFHPERSICFEYCGLTPSERRFACDEQTLGGVEDDNWRGDNWLRQVCEKKLCDPHCGN